MRPSQLDAWPPLPPGVYLRRPAGPLPFPLEEPGCRLFSRARYALLHGLRALGLGAGDEVLVPALHHGAEVEALLRANLTCRFYEMGSNLQPREDDLEALLGRCTRALYLTHVLGFPRDAPRWLDWCRERRLLLIEDAAQAWLAQIGGRPLGSFGDLSIFCMYKTVGIGQGAALLLCHPAEQAASHRLDAWQLARGHHAWLLSRSAGLTTLHATLRGRRRSPPAGEHQLDSVDVSPPRLTRFLLSSLLEPDPAAQRRRNYQLLLDHLGDQVPEAFAKLPEGAAPFAFPLDVEDKPKALASLQRQSIRALDFWSAPHPSLPRTGFPESTWLRRHLIGLPVHQELRFRDLHRIVAAVHGVTAGNGELEPEVTRMLDPLQAAWSTLAEASRSVFATWDWMSTWWRHFGRDRELLVTVCRSGSQVVGIVPLYVWSRRPFRVLRLLGHGQADQLGAICADADHRAVVDSLRLALTGLDWDILLAEQLAGKEPWEDGLRARRLLREASPVLRFDERGWEGFLSTRSSNFREQVRRRPRKLAREHDVRYRLVDGSEGLQSELDTLFRLHAARWTRGRSSFLSDEAFHRAFAATAARRGWLRLWFLEVEGQPVAALYGFRFAGAESYYQAGRDPAWDGYAPGFVLLTHAIARAAEDGVKEYRLLRGGEDYKYRFANADEGLVTVGLNRGRAAGAALRLLPAAVPARHALRQAGHRLAARASHVAPGGGLHEAGRSGGKM
jgi:perosamine synthetase